jgi:hypothetical protein
LIQWYNATSTIITLNNFFGKHTNKQPIKTDDYALVFDIESNHFLPACVLKRVGDEIYVKYIDGRM